MEKSPQSINSSFSIYHYTSFLFFFYKMTPNPNMCTLHLYKIIIFTERQLLNRAFWNIINLILQLHVALNFQNIFYQALPYIGKFIIILNGFSGFSLLIINLLKIVMTGTFWMACLGMGEAYTFWQMQISYILNLVWVSKNWQYTKSNKKLETKRIKKCKNKSKSAKFYLICSVSILCEYIIFHDGILNTQMWCFSSGTTKLS